VSAAPTIVMTQRGARAAFQSQLRDRGVEVVEFDFLTPEAVAAYCYERGFLQVRRNVSIADARCLTNPCGLLPIACKPANSSRQNAQFVE